MDVLDVRDDLRVILRGGEEGEETLWNVLPKDLSKASPKLSRGLHLAPL